MLNLVASTRLTGGRLSLNGNDLAEGQGEDAEMLRALYTAVGLDYPKFHKMDMYARLALLASEPLYRMLRADGADIANAIGLITLNRSGSAATDVEHWEPVRRG